MLLKIRDALSEINQRASNEQHRKRQRNIEEKVIDQYCRRKNHGRADRKSAELHAQPAEHGRHADEVRCLVAAVPIVGP